MRNYPKLILLTRPTAFKLGRVDLLQNMHVGSIEMSIEKSTDNGSKEKWLPAGVGPLHNVYFALLYVKITFWISPLHSCLERALEEI